MVIVKLTKEQIESLKNCGADKGTIVEQFFDNNEIKWCRFDDLEEQVNIGDYYIENKNNSEDIIRVEVKSSHTFKKTNLPKLACDFKHYQKYSDCKVPYIQKTTGDDLGWLHRSQADWLIAFNYEHSKLYVIKDYQKVKDIVLEKTKEYFNRYGARTWFFRELNKMGNIIYPRRIEGGLKYDTCKESLIASLTLDKSTIGSLDGKLIIFDVIIEEEIEKRPEKNTFVSQTEGI